MDNGFCCGNWCSSLESEDGLDVLVAEREVMVSGVGLAMKKMEAMMIMSLAVGDY